jgi:hypothetical protein
MANRFAVASGNFNATSTWATTAAGAAGASVPVAGDVAIANNRTVTITADATCTELRNDNFSSATAGGGFILNDSVTLTANVIGGSVSASRCVTYQGTTSAAIVGNCTGGSGSFVHPNQTVAVYHNGSGTLTVTGTTHAGGAGQYAAAFLTNSNGVLTIGGNINPAAGSANGRTIMHGGGVINVIGEVTANATTSSTAVTISGSSATPFISTLNVTGSITASATNAVAIGAGTMTIVGSCTAANGVAAIESSSNSAAIRASGSFICATDGTLPIYARKFILNTTPTAARTRYALNGSGTYVDMFTADNTGLAPAVADVRAGVVYGSATGALAVPPANSVAFGVAVDNTTGTAVLTPEAVWGAATRTLTSASGPTAADNATAVWAAASRTITGGTVDTLTNAPSVPSASAIASQVRSELSVELGRIDAATSTRATPANIPTSDITAIKNKTDLLNTTRLAQTATTEIVGNLLAQANS